MADQRLPTDAPFDWRLQEVAAYDVALGPRAHATGSDTTRWLTSGSQLTPPLIVAAVREIRTTIRGSLSNAVKIPAISIDLVG